MSKSKFPVDNKVTICYQKFGLFVTLWTLPMRGGTSQNVTVKGSPNFQAVFARKAHYLGHKNETRTGPEEQG